MMLWKQYIRNFLSVYGYDRKEKSSQSVLDFAVLLRAFYDIDQECRGQERSGDAFV